MKRKKVIARRKLKKGASQPQGKKIPSSFLSARPGVKSVLQLTETPSDLPLPLMALFKAISQMPSEHNILILVEDAIFGLQVEYIYVPKDDVFLFSRMEQIYATIIAVYMK